MEDIKEKGLQVNQWAVVCCQKAPGEPRADPRRLWRWRRGRPGPARPAHRARPGTGQPTGPGWNSAPRSPAAAPRHPTAELMRRRRSDRAPKSAHRNKHQC